MEREEEMMSTLKAARIATSDDKVYTHYAQSSVKTTKQIEIHCNSWKMRRKMHMTNS